MVEIELNSIQIEQVTEFLLKHEDDIALDFMQGWSRDYSLLKEFFEIIIGRNPEE